MTKIIKLNVFDKKLKLCSKNPLTGFYRDGCCSSSNQDSGEHHICVVVKDDFLNFSKKNGNDLITPNELFDFPGLKDGDRWCVCTNRWLEALKSKVAPKIFLESTNKLVLSKINIEILKKFALDIN